MARHDAVVLFLATGLFVLFLSSALLRSNPQVAHRNTIRNQEEDCTTDLAKDLYGLGVRLGVYFQWFSAWAANTFVLDEIAGALDANAIFLFALLISIVNATRSNNGQMSQMDSLIMIQLCAGTVWSVLSLWGYRTCVYRKEGLDGIRHFGGFGTHFRLLLGAALGWYAMWFWIKGLGFNGGEHTLRPFELDPQQEQYCITREVSIFGQPIRRHSTHYTALAISAVWTTYSILVTLASPLAAVTRALKMFHFARNKQYASTSRLRYTTGIDEAQLRIMSLVLACFTFFLIIFMMTMTELTLNENHAVGVLGATPGSNNGGIATPSQLLPMLVGAFGFVRVLFIAWELWRSPDGDISPSLGRSSSKRNAAPRPDSTRGFNVFRIFATGVAETTDEYEREDHFDEDQLDRFHDLQQRLPLWKRIFITWLPWLSLLCSWPWQKDGAHKVLRDEAEMQLHPQQKSPPPSNPRGEAATVHWEDVRTSNVVGDDTSYRRLSDDSIYETVQPTKTL